MTSPRCPRRLFFSASVNTGLHHESFAKTLKWLLSSLIFFSPPRKPYSLTICLAAPSFVKWARSVISKGQTWFLASCKFCQPPWLYCNFYTVIFDYYAIHGMVKNTVIVGDVIVAVTYAVWLKVHVVPLRLPFVLPYMSPRRNFLNGSRTIGYSVKPDHVLPSHL